MGRGRLILDIYKDHPADPYFWIMLEGVNNPYKVFYGREGWKVDLNKKETRAKYEVDRVIRYGETRLIIASIDIAGPMDEIIKLIELAGYHHCGGPARPMYLNAPKKSLNEVSRHLATLELLRELSKNDPSAPLAARQWPLDRPTRYDGVIDITPVENVGETKLLASNL